MGDDSGVTRGAITGAAWLSSARAVRCWVKSPQRAQPSSLVTLSSETASRKEEEGGDDVKSSWPLCLGLHTRYNGRYNGLLKRELGANPNKAGPSWDCRLKPACMNAESLVTAGQHTAVNTFPGLVHTARHVMEVEND